jgi:hypothetical protein
MFNVRNLVVAFGTVLAAPLLGACGTADPGPTGTQADLQTGTASQALLSPGKCRTAEDCPLPAVACRLCPDGVNFTCPEAVCTDGQCGIDFTQCPAPPPPPDPGIIQCGGFAGLPCPDGFTCVDDPRDDCSPCRGGADCGGICVEVSCSGKGTGTTN